MKQIRFTYNFGETGSRRGIGAAIVLATWLLLVTWPHTASASADKPVLVVAATLIVDQANSGSGLITLRNPNPQELKKGILSASDFVSQVTGLPLGVRFGFSAPSSQGGVPAYRLPEDIPSGGTQIVRVDVTNLWEAGESIADLVYNGEKIGILRALKYPVPFAVNLQASPPDSPTMTLERGRPCALILKNDDAMTYPIRWELAIGGRKVTGFARIPPKGTASLEVMPLLAWFAWYRGLFKEDVQDAQLTLSYPGTDARSEVPLQVRTIPLKSRLLWSAAGQQALATAVIFFILLLGGVCSLVASYWVPNRLRRRDFIEQLAALAVKIRGLSLQIDSSLRVLVRVQHHRLLGMPFSRWTLSPDLANVFSQCARSIATLSRQVGLLGSINDTYGQLKATAASFPPPSLLDRIEQELKKAEKHLNTPEPEEADFQVGQALVSQAQARLEAINQADPAFAQELVDRVKSLCDRLGPNALGKMHECHEFSKALPTAFAILKAAPPDPAHLDPADYPSIDADTAKLMVIQDYLEMCATAAVPDLQKKELLEHLTHKSWQELQAARQAVKQIREGIFYGDVVAEIKNEAALIVVDPNVARTYLPVQFSVFFRRKELNNAAACSQLNCIWDFGHDGLREAGWKVSHYFPEQRKEGYRVKAFFEGEDGQPIMDADGKQITIPRHIKVQADPAAKRYDRLGTEAIYLGIVLFATLLALVSGAQQQLAKMDLIPGLIGVFVLGFTADQVKNLLTQRTPGGGRQ